MDGRPWRRTLHPDAATSFAPPSLTDARAPSGALLCAWLSAGRAPAAEAALRVVQVGDLVPLHRFDPLDHELRDAITAAHLEGPARVVVDHEHTDLVAV